MAYLGKILNYLHDNQWMISLGGWIVIIWNGTRLARRAETRALCTSIQVLIDRIDQGARKEWPGKTNLPRYTEESFSADVNALEYRISQLEAIIGGLSCTDELAELRFHLTSEISISASSGSGLDELCAKKVLDIWTACSFLNEEVDRAYLQAYSFGRFVKVKRRLLGSF